MIRWLAFKAFMKKGWVWVKTYWYLPVSALWMVVTWFFFRQKAAMMIENFKETREAHKKEIDIINKSKEEEVNIIKEKIEKSVERNRKAEEEYRKTTEAIDKHASERAELLKLEDLEILAGELKKLVKGERK